MSQSEQMKSWAMIGANHRLAEIKAEMTSIIAFLDEAKSHEKRPGSSLKKVRKVVKKKRRGMSSAARKAVSKRMKKYWADRRKAKAEK